MGPFGSPKTRAASGGAPQLAAVLTGLQQAQMALFGSQRFMARSGGSPRPAPLPSMLFLQLQASPARSQRVQMALFGLLNTLATRSGGSPRPAPLPSMLF